MATNLSLNLNVQIRPGNQKIIVMWNFTNINLTVDGFVVYLGFSRSDLKQIATLPRETRQYVFTREQHKIVNGRVYYISVRAFKGEQSPQSSRIYAITPSSPRHLKEDNKIHNQDYIVYPSDQEILEEEAYIEPPPQPPAEMPAAEPMADQKAAPEINEEPPAEIETEQPLFQGDDVVGQCTCGMPIKLTAKLEYRCTNRRCLKEYVFNVKEKLLEVSRLKWGTCQCCKPKRILIFVDPAIVCSITGKKHALFPDGKSVLLENYGLGTCTCCNPPRPLVNYGNGTICSGSGEKYEKQNGIFVLKKPELTTDVLEIKDLLDNGEITILPGGVVHRDEGKEQKRRRR